MQTARVFMNGRSQAVRIPWRHRLRSKEVYIRKTGNGLLITEKSAWDTFTEGVMDISDSFMAERAQPPLENRRSIKGKQ